MEKNFELKVYLPKKVEVVALPREMFQTKVMRINAEVAREYLEEKYPLWRRAILIMTCARAKNTNAQRTLIERT